MSSADDRLKKALSDFDDASRQVSTNNRYISFGLVAIAYTLLSSTAPIADAVVRSHGLWVLLVGAIGCIGVVFDYLHYFCATQAAQLAIDNETAGHEHQYNKKWRPLIWQKRFYVMRTIASLGGALVLIVLIGLSAQTYLATSQSAPAGSSAIQDSQKGPKNASGRIQADAKMKKCHPAKDSKSLPRSRGC